MAGDGVDEVLRGMRRGAALTAQVCTDCCGSARQAQDEDARAGAGPMTVSSRFQFSDWLNTAG